MSGIPIVKRGGIVFVPKYISYVSESPSGSKHSQLSVTGISSSAELLAGERYVGVAGALFIVVNLQIGPSLSPPKLSLATIFQ